MIAIITIVTFVAGVVTTHLFHQKKVSKLVRSHQDELRETYFTAFGNGWKDGHGYQIQQWEIDHAFNKSVRK